MATEKQIAANRANGAKGGPRTQEGKDRCKMNALKHGLSCKTAVIMKGEKLEDFKEIYQQFFSTFQPVNGAELRLVQRLANADWKGNRKEIIETGLLDWHVVKERHQVALDCKKLNHPMPQDTEPARFVGLAFDKPDPNMDRFLRYAAAIDREFHKTLAELITMVKLRGRLPAPEPGQPCEEPQPPMIDAAPAFVAATASATETPAAATPTPEIGSVRAERPASVPSVDPAPDFPVPATIVGPTGVITQP